MEMTIMNTTKTLIVYRIMLKHFVDNIRMYRTSCHWHVMAHTCGTVYYTVIIYPGI